MKKILLTIGVLFTSLFMFSGEASAEELVLCKYEREYEGKKNVSIAITYDGTTGRYNIHTADLPMNWVVNIGKFWAYGFGDYDRVYDWYDSKHIKMSTPAEKAIKNAECPENAYYDPDGTIEVCFDNNRESAEDGWCRTKKKPYKDHEKIALKSETFNDTLIQLNSDVRMIKFDDVACSEVNSEADALVIVNSKLNIIVQEIADTFPKGYAPNAYKQLQDSYIYRLHEYGYTEFKNRCIAEIDAQQAAGTITADQANHQKASLEISADKIKSTWTYNSFLDLFNREYKGKIYCGFIGEKTFGYIKMIYSIIKFLIPAVIILLGMTDFLKVLFSGEDKDMKEAWTKFVKRLIAGIIFILLPVLIEFVFKIVGFSEDCLQQLIS